MSQDTQSRSTGTPPHGKITPQGPAAQPTTEQRLAAVETRMERIEAMVGETGGRLGELLIALVERHNFLERIVYMVSESYYGSGLLHTDVVQNLDQFPYDENGQHPPIPQSDVPPSVVVPASEEDGDDEEEETPEESQDGS